MKIKVAKKLTLLELLQKFDAEEVPEGRYYSKTHPNRGVELSCGVGVSFLNKGGYPTGYSSGYLDDFYEVEFKEEVTEDTVFDELIFVYKEAGLFSINSKRCASVAEIVSYLNCDEVDEVSHFYIMNPDGTIGDLIWSNGEMVE